MDEMSMEDDPLGAWRDAVHAAELAERLATIASHARPTPGRDASSEIAAMAQRAAEAATRAADRARTAADEAARSARLHRQTGPALP
jgi:hypothetical protein